jgi:TRAP-type uncharacterized transport system substrate-binding protein
MKCLIMIAAIASFLTLAVAAAPSHAAAPGLDVGTSQGVVVLETEGSPGISGRIAEELARLINDGSRRRILPVIGIGSLQNIMDLRLLRGIDVAILQKDVLDYAKQQNLVPHTESRITYITTLYNEEFHLLARPEIKSISDLANHKVSVDVHGSGTAVTAARLFDLLGIAVTTTNDDPEEALEKLRQGEAVAVALVAGKPAPVFCDLISENGLHFFSIPPDAAVGAGYVPARLTAADYPGLIPYNQPVDTVAVGTLLAATEARAGSDLSQRHQFRRRVLCRGPVITPTRASPKWREVNIRAELPGWRRFPPAAHWLQRNAQVATAPDVEGLKANFSRFIDERQQASSGPPLSQQDKDQIYDQFKRWASERPGLWQRLGLQ